MLKQAFEYGKKLLKTGLTPHKLTIASCGGIFVAFSPFLGLHWLLTIVLAGLLRLNVGVMFAVAHIVNNPLTMLPIYFVNNAVGQFITRTLFGVDLSIYDPWWMSYVNKFFAFIGSYIPIQLMHVPQVSLWAFIIGGHVLGIGLAFLCYPFILHFYKRILTSSGTHA